MLDEPERRVRDDVVVPVVGERVVRDEAEPVRRPVPRPPRSPRRASSATTRSSSLIALAIHVTSCRATRPRSAVTSPPPPRLRASRARLLVAAVGRGPSVRDDDQPPRRRRYPSSALTKRSASRDTDSPAPIFELVGDRADDRDPAPGPGQVGLVRKHAGARGVEAGALVDDVDRDPVGLQPVDDVDHALTLAVGMANGVRAGLGDRQASVPRASRRRSAARATARSARGARGRCIPAARESADERCGRRHHCRPLKSADSS